MRRIQIRNLTILCYCLMICTVFSLPTDALTEEISDGVVAVEYVGTRRITASLTISNGQAVCTGTIVASDESYDATVYVYLKQYKNSQWTTIATWSGSGSGAAEAGGSKSITSGYNYKIVTVGRVYDSNGVLIERVSKTSSTKSY